MFFYKGRPVTLRGRTGMASIRLRNNRVFVNAFRGGKLRRAGRLGRPTEPTLLLAGSKTPPLGGAAFQIGFSAA